MGKFWKNVLTFGGQYRIDKENAIYEGILKDLYEINAEMELKKSKVNEDLNEALIIKQDAIKVLNKITKITKHLKGKERELFLFQFKSKKESIYLSKIENTLSIANSVLSIGKGVGAGLATSNAAVLLVGAFGSASTGTAIGSLTGAAATNATLAWLGGGSIASGGGGMAAGSVVLGGIVVIPALAVMAFLNHSAANKEIKEIKKNELKALKTIDEIKSNLTALDVIEKRCDEVNSATIKFQDTFELVLKKTYRGIYRIPLISRFIKFIRDKFGYQYFSKKDLQLISNILKDASAFAKLIDTKIIE